MPCGGIAALGDVRPGFALAVAGAAIVIAPEQRGRRDVEIEAAAVGADRSGSATGSGSLHIRGG